MGIFLFIVCLLLLVFCFIRDGKWASGVGDWIFNIIIYGIMAIACTFVIVYPLEGLLLVAILIAFAWD